ncbi:MAG TPA: rhodanese-like domain-containing protein [Noviherbaspirillum sp.]|uniref:rhodanese-like domain-containing protein n=1 Tax=Noviherbaspirillum sp. TaxID=1926288 RepID=UPI002D28B9D2|nr:rhodanese-like domain-containing protein [Noviherbaspirillum sp.]HYD94488.1 rhodanese-like domain-containing protein [Noviherbaspirillum sp.]
MQTRRTVIQSLLAGGLSACCMVSFAADFGTVDVQQGQAMARQGALLLDVREQSEYDAGHAPGSTLIPLGQLKNRLGEIGAHQNKPVVVICRSGNRSAQASGILAQQGFRNVHNVQGGMLAWEKAGLPVEKK